MQSAVIIKPLKTPYVLNPAIFFGWPQNPWESHLPLNLHQGEDVRHPRVLFQVSLKPGACEAEGSDQTLEAQGHGNLEL